MIDYTETMNNNSNVKSIKQYFSCNQYYCNSSLYINYIYSIICHGISLKKNIGNGET